MSVTVVGTWDLGWNTPIKEVELWAFALAEYGVARWYMSPVSGIAGGVPWLSEDAQMEDRLELERKAGQTLVFVDERAPEDLVDFVHPQDACYVLGKAGFSPMRSLGYGERAVRIPTSANKGGFWPHQAIAIVLHDRWVKGP